MWFLGRLWFGVSTFTRILGASPRCGALRGTMGDGGLPIKILNISKVRGTRVVGSLYNGLSHETLIVVPSRTTTAGLYRSLHIFNGGSFLCPTESFSFASTRGHSRRCRRHHVGTLAGVLGNATSVIIYSTRTTIREAVPPRSLGGRSLAVEQNRSVGLNSVADILLSTNCAETSVIRKMNRFSIHNKVLSLFSPSSRGPIEVRF